MLAVRLADCVIARLASTRALAGQGQKVVRAIGRAARAKGQGGSLQAGVSGIVVSGR